MHRLLVALTVTAAAISATATAHAQYYDPYYRGGGYYSPPPPPPPTYGRRYDGPGYGPPPGYGYRYRNAPAYVDRHGQQTYYPGPRGQCPRGYTVQDGVCKPYRGY